MPRPSSQHYEKLLADLEEASREFSGGHGMKSTLDGWATLLDAFWKFLENNEAPTQHRPIIQSLVGELANIENGGQSKLVDHYKQQKSGKRRGQPTPPSTDQAFWAAALVVVDLLKQAGATLEVAARQVAGEFEKKGWPNFPGQARSQELQGWKRLLNKRENVRRMKSGTNQIRILYDGFLKEASKLQRDVGWSPAQVAEIFLYYEMPKLKP